MLVIIDINIMIEVICFTTVTQNNIGIVEVFHNGFESIFETNMSFG